MSAEILSHQRLSWKVYSNLGDRDFSAEIETCPLRGRAWAKVAASLDKVRFLPDTQPKGPRDLFCFLLKRELSKTVNGEEELTDFGLVLEQVEPERNRFKRVGFCKERVVYKDTGPKTVRLSANFDEPLPTICELGDKSNLLEAMSDCFTLFHGRSSDVEIEIV